MAVGVSTWVGLLGGSAGPDVRARAATELGTYRYADVETGIVAALIEALDPREDDRWGIVQQAACDALVALGPEVEAPLISTLRDQRLWVRVSAIEALGRLGSRRAVPRLISMLGDDDLSVRTQVAEALGRIGGARALDALVQFESAEWARFRAGVPPDALNAVVDALVGLGHYEASELVDPEAPGEPGPQW